MAEFDWFPPVSVPVFGKPTLGAAFQPYYGGAPLRTFLPLYPPVFPDFVRATPSLHPARQFAESFAPRFTFVTVPMTWKTSAPDQIPRRKLLTPSMWTDVLQVNLPAAPTIARVIAPEWLPRPVWRRPTDPMTQVFPSTLVTVGWRGQYPDAISRKRISPSQMQSFAFGYQSTNARMQEWTAQYPALHWRKRIPTETWTKFDPFPLPNAAAPTWSWWGYQPDRLYPKAGLHASEQQAFASDRIRPVQPDFSWQAIAPDLLWRKKLLTAARPTVSFQQPIIAPDLRMDWQATFTMPFGVKRRWMTPLSFLPEPTVSPVVWYPRYIDSFERISRPMPEMQEIAWGGTVLNPNTLAWHTDTNELPRIRAVVQPPQVLLDPVLPTLHNLCVWIRRDLVSIATIRSDQMTSPTITEEFLTAPTVRDEEVC